MASLDDDIRDAVDAARHRENAGPAYERTLEIAGRSPSDALSLAMALLDALPEGPVLFDAAISYVADDDIASLVADAMYRLERVDPALRESSAAAAVVAYVSLQAATVLEPYLADIWRLQPNAGTYYEMWPWRGATVDQAHDMLRVCADRKTGEPDRVRAWRALLETRKPEILAEALAVASAVQSQLSNTALAHLHQVGYDRDSARGLRHLTRDPVLHLRFPPGYFRDVARPVWIKRSTHPSWRPTTPALGTAVVGGGSEASCRICGRQLLQLLVLKDGLASFGVASRNRLEVSMCDVCVAYSPAVFYLHDDSGAPESLGGERATGMYEWDPASLLSVQVEIVQNSRRWKHQDWALSNSRENLYRLAGEPTWIQSAEFPICPSCNVRMQFLLQFDSDVPDVKGGEWSCGAGSGIAYVFWCDSCAVSAASIQDT